MKTLGVPSGVFRFPQRCVECGASPTRSFSLVLPRGLDVRRIEAPLCDRHGERKSLAQFGWILGSVAVGITLIVLLAVVVDAITPSCPVLRQLTGPIVALLLALATVPVWLAARRGRRSFHRRFSAVWVEGVTSDAEVTLGFRTVELRHEVAAASGLAVGAAATFRTPGGPPAAFVAQKNPIPGWAVALAGLLVVFAGMSEYIMLGRAEARGETISHVWLEILIYDLFGRGGVLALFVVIGAVLIAAGVALWRKASEP